MNYLSVENLTKSYGARVLFKDLSFGINKGQKMALVAKNGTGKSSLLKIISGIDTADSGQVTLRKGVRVLYLGQDPQLPAGKTIEEAVFESDNPVLVAIREYEATINDPNKAEHMQAAMDNMERIKAWDFEAKVKQILGRLELKDLSLKVDKLSGGQQKRVALAKVLMEEPDLLILDEPTNHLDLEMIEWLEEYLSRDNLSLLMVTHDRYFLERVCDEILEMEDAKLYRHKGNYSYFLEKKTERQENESVTVGKAKNLMKKELEWIRRQPKARGTKSKARVDAFDGIKEQASKKVDKKQVEMEIAMTRLGGKILELHRLRKSYGEKTILNGFDYSFRKGERLGIVGNNGTGKSTFLKLITGKEELDGGKIITGETVKFGYYTQDGINLKDDKRVIEVIKDIAEYIPVGRKGSQISASQMLERFLFEGDAQYTFVSKLSGGERRRLYLLTVLMSNPNFLILDEPTNDLDILTLNVLEEFLLEFQGCLVVVTHDRYFMDKLTEHLFVFEGNGEVNDFIGSYSEYRVKKKAKVQAEKQAERKVEKAEATKTETRKTDKPKVKLSYKEKLEFEQLEKDIEKLEERKAEITNLFSQNNSDAEEIEKLSREMNEIIANIETKEMRWLELSEYEA